MNVTEATLSVMMPVTIDDTTLTSTTVAEADHPEWDGVTTFGLGERVISKTTHRIYESARASNTNHDPDDIDNRVSTSAGDAWWIDVSATNAWKMFDGQSSSRTSDASPLTLVLEPGYISSIYGGGIGNADDVTITVKSTPGGTVVYTKTISLEDSLPPDYWEYCFSPYHQQSDFVVSDIPPYLNCEVTITFTAASGNVEIGMLQVGDLRPIGTTLLKAAALPKTYSYIKIDEFGENEITRRKSARDMNLTAHVEKDYADTAIDILTQLLDVPSVWIGTTADKYAALRVFGIASGKMNYDTPDHFFLNIDIKGLI